VLAAIGKCCGVWTYRNMWDSAGAWWCCEGLNISFSCITIDLKVAQVVRQTSQCFYGFFFTSLGLDQSQLSADYVLRFRCFLVLRQDKSLKWKPTHNKLVLSWMRIVFRFWVICASWVLADIMIKSSCCFWKCDTLSIHVFIYRLPQVIAD
jgi:hypothetical protein